MKLRSNIIFWLSIVLGLLACQKKQCTYVCQNLDVHIMGIGFKESDLDTVLVKEYFAYDSFKELLSVKMLYNPGLSIPNDSTLVHIAEIECYKDWELYIPATGQTYRFTEIKDAGTSTKEGDCETTRGCYNEVVSLKMNGSIVAGNVVRISK